MSVVFSFFIPMGNIALALAVPSMVVYLLTYGVFAYEEKNKAHLLNISLPVERSALCISKYLTGLIYITASGLISILGASLGAGLLGRNNLVHTATLMINTISILLAIALIYNSIVLPCIIYFGTIKMKYIIFALYFMSFAVLGMLGKGENLQQMNAFMQTRLRHIPNITILLGSIILYIISYLVSKSLYAHKEFK
jgi:putative exporter of polyketide antibiotics